MKPIPIIFLTVILLGCKQTPSIDQKKLCTINHIGQRHECTSGEIVSYLPNAFGNAQLPLLIASGICNFNYPIVHNNGGVICVYTDEREDMIE